jgi:hypothetical protein
MFGLQGQKVAGSIQFIRTTSDFFIALSAKDNEPTLRYILGIEIYTVFSDVTQSGMSVAEILATEANFTKDIEGNKFGLFLTSRPQGVDAKLLLINH